LAFLAGFFAAFFAAFLAAFFVAMVTVTSSWQIRLTVPKAACYVDLPSKDGGPRPTALPTACQSWVTGFQVFPFTGEVIAVASPVLFFPREL
jgi:hypothetical protein